MDTMNQNQQWSINQPQQPMNQQWSQNQPQSQMTQPRANWNNPVVPPVQMPAYGSPQWWQMMFNQNLINGLNIPQQTQSGQVQGMQMSNQMGQNTNPIPQTVNQISSARVISSLEEVKPSEVPVDDAIRIFMTDDLQTIYAKKWNNAGELDNMVFQRVPDEKKPQIAQVDSGISETVESQNGRISALEDRIDALLDATTELSNKITKMEVNGSKASPKKGGMTNE